jgi:hypothetical protein
LHAIFARVAGAEQQDAVFLRIGLDHFHHVAALGVFDALLAVASWAPCLLLAVRP